MRKDIEENRDMDRRRILKAGVICFNLRQSVIPCTVRNISESGAQLIVSDVRLVPHQFELNVELDGIWADCEVVWKNNKGCVGVKFVSEPVVTAPRRRQALQQSLNTQTDTTAGDEQEPRTRSVENLKMASVLTGKTVLVVDDDPIFCGLARDAFGQAGASTVIASSGLDALELLAETKIDAATIDLIMPEMDGFRLLAHMRHTPGTRHVPVVVVTSRDTEKCRREASLHGVSSYQLKPVVWPDLVTAVASSLQPSDASGSSQN